MESNLKFRPLFRILPSGLIAFLVPLGVEARGNGGADPAVPLRIGWPIPTATQGQVLKRTSVLEGQGLTPRLKPFSFGGPQRGAGFARRNDVKQDDYGTWVPR